MNPGVASLSEEDRAMSKPRLVLRAAGRSFLPTVDAVVARERPAEPLVCLRPAVIASASRDGMAPSAFLAERRTVTAFM